MGDQKWVIALNHLGALADQPQPLRSPRLGFNPVLFRIRYGGAFHTIHPFRCYGFCLVCRPCSLLTSKNVTHRQPASRHELEKHACFQRGWPHEQGVIITFIPMPVVAVVLAVFIYIGASRRTTRGRDQAIGGSGWNRRLESRHELGVSPVLQNQPRVVRAQPVALRTAMRFHSH